ncbi:MAG: hypothetical protein GX219_07845 [Tissierellia bacterium]|nr:hypothetical protein [Tissierellia bacterium]
MKKLIISLLILAILFTGCEGEWTITGPLKLPEGVNLSISKENLLLVEKDNKTYYVGKDTSSEVFPQGKDLAVLFKSRKGEFSIRNSYPNESGVFTMINALNLDKDLIIIGGRTYKLGEYKEDIQDGLDLNEVFTKGQEGTISINPDNYGEFIDDDGRVYRQGDEYKGEATMLMDGEEAEKIKTVSYGGIYQGEDLLLVEVDGTYYTLVEEASK